jgi:hypothetical protein
MRRPRTPGAGITRAKRNSLGGGSNSPNRLSVPTIQRRPGDAGEPDNAARMASRMVRGATWSSRARPNLTRILSRRHRARLWPSLALRWERDH